MKCNVRYKGRWGRPPPVQEGGFGGDTPHLNWHDPGDQFPSRPKIFDPQNGQKCYFENFLACNAKNRREAPKETFLVMASGGGSRPSRNMCSVCAYTHTERVSRHTRACVHKCCHTSGVCVTVEAPTTRCLGGLTRTTCRRTVTATLAAGFGTGFGLRFGLRFGDSFAVPLTRTTRFTTRLRVLVAGVRSRDSFVHLMTIKRNRNPSSQITLECPKAFMPK